MLRQVENKRRSDDELLREFVAEESETAFAELVSRHINLVYSVAVRAVRDSHLAQDITQSVFVILARKAGSLGGATNLIGWLCQTARFTALKAATVHRRRQIREQEAYMRTTLEAGDDSNDVWPEIEPHLEPALRCLRPQDHNALVLRYFAGQSFSSVAAALGTSEASAKMRVARALEKLRKVLAKRGVTVSSSVLATAVASHSVQAAPAGLAASVSFAAVHPGALGSSAAMLTDTTMRYMAYAKLKSALLAISLALAAAGAASVPLVLDRIESARLTAGHPDYSTPEGTLAALRAALTRADTNAFAAACTPEQAHRFMQRNLGKSPSELRGEAAEMLSALSGFRILRREQSEEDVIHLWLTPAGASDTHSATRPHLIMRFQNIDGQWKYAGDRP